jgi:hypothetical protein
MENMTQQEIEKITFIRKGRFSLLGNRILQLQVSEGIKVFPKDISNKKSMYRTINNIAKKYNRQFETGILPDGKGWGVVRVA